MTTSSSARSWAPSRRKYCRGNREAPGSKLLYSIVVVEFLVKECVRGNTTTILISTRKYFFFQTADFLRVRTRLSRYSKSNQAVPDQGDGRYV